MANSGKPNSAELLADVAARLRALRPPGAPVAHVLLGLSGGMDSMALLDILHRLASELGFSLAALHVNHGISPNAADWADFCEAECGKRAVPIVVERVNLDCHPGLGLEGAAREARFQALARHAVDVVALAQHRDDQAETLLLQLLRGSGLRGLAAMPAERDMQGTQARLIRPFIHVPRSVIADYAGKHDLAWVEDESNADQRLLRNFVRHRVIAPLEEKFPGAQAVMADSASRLADAAGLLDQLGDEDLSRLAREGGVDAGQLVMLGEARACNALRRWCEQCGVPWPGTASLKELLRQLTMARPGAAIAVAAGKWRFRAYRAVLYLEPEVAPDAGYSREWRGEARMALAELGGVLCFDRAEGRGLRAALLQGRTLSVRLRRGGEKLRPDCKRPRRDLKYLFVEHAIPGWRRNRLPLIFCGDELVAIPGIAEDCRWRAQSGEQGLVIAWSGPQASAPGTRPGN
jgi:tRNA(Ile)-lysidine synthase